MRIGVMHPHVETQGLPLKNIIATFTYCYNVACPKCAKLLEVPQIKLEPTEEMNHLNALLTVLKNERIQDNSDGELLKSRIEDCARKQH